MMNLLNELKISSIKAAVAAGTTTQTSSGVSCNGADNFLFLVLIGTITATGVPVVSVQGSTDGGSNYSDLEGSGVTLTATDDDGKVIAVEVDHPRPTFTHLRVQVTRPTANAVIDRILCLERGKRLQPVTQGTLVHASSKSVVSPPAGTA